jgi:hypothetical protein
MYSLVKNLRQRRDLLVEGTACIVSFVIAELFYKFHSFTLECAAFLATWLAVSYVLISVADLLGSGRKAAG